MVHPLPKGVGELVFGDGPDYPLQARLEAVLGQRAASQLQCYIPEEKKKVYRGEFTNRVSSRSSLLLCCHLKSWTEAAGVD
jgi:hypothetical protein